jgi:protein ImuB
MLWLGLFLPRLPIEVFLRGVDCGAPDTRGGAQRSARRTAPHCLPDHRLPADPLLAVCDHTRVLQASDSAQALGVRPGIKRATALALAPDLGLVERDATLERDALRQFACWALQFTPSVSLQGDPLAGDAGTARPAAPGSCGLLLEVEPSLRLFGGLDALITRVRTGSTQLGFAVQIACAPSATGAWLLARHRDGLRAQTESQLNARLAALPVALLDAGRPHLDTLDSIGIRTLKDLVQLPRAGLARRFGKALLVELDRAFGRQPEPRLWFEAPPVFEARLELLAQVENAESLLFAARRLIVQLGGWLGARHAAVRAFELLGEHDDLPATRLSVRLADASRDIDRLTGLLRETLAVTALPAPVHTLRLRCDQVTGLAAANGEMFPLPASSREGLGRLVERLQARLGRTQVQRLLLAQDHRPEAAYRLEPVDRLPRTEPPRTEAPGAPQPASTRGPSSAAKPRRGAAVDPKTPAADPAAGGTLPRPLWLLSRPIALTERNNRPYWHGPLTLLAGPERIESGWWDDALVQRDYFIAADDSDILLWIYRERLPDADSRKGWFLQGRFG